jgi:hypothetical protein
MKGNTLWMKEMLGLWTHFLAALAGAEQLGRRRPGLCPRAASRIESTGTGGHESRLPRPEEDRPAFVAQVAQDANELLVATYGPGSASLLVGCPPSTRWVRFGSSSSRSMPGERRGGPKQGLPPSEPVHRLAVSHS